MKITTHGELGWALAYDEHITSPMSGVMECLELGCRVQYTRKRGLGASSHVDYAPVYQLIESFPRGERAVGHYLYGPWHIENAGIWLDRATRTLEKRLYLNHANFKKWSRKKKYKAWYLIQTALMAYRQCESGKRPRWSPQKIRQHMLTQFDERLETRYWEKNWQPCWQAIEEALDEINRGILTPVSELLVELNQLERSA